jgi:uncharacterized protein (DUF1499 family)
VRGRLALALAATFGCASPPRAPMAPCPESPNCVSSEAADAAHAVAPFELAVAPGRAWAAAREAVAELPRTRIAEERAGYLRAVCRSRLLRFADDLELELRTDPDRIAVRSASRVGYSDLGVNRRRVESLRARLRERGVLR